MPRTLDRHTCRDTCDGISRDDWKRALAQWMNESINDSQSDSITGKDGSWSEGNLQRPGLHPQSLSDSCACFLADMTRRALLAPSSHQDELTLLKTPTEGLSSPLCSLLGILSQKQDTYWISVFSQAKFQTKRSSNLFFTTDLRREAACFSWFYPEECNLNVSFWHTYQKFLQDENRSPKKSHC